MKLIICFIDDSEFEHDLVREEISPFAPDLDFVQARTFDEAKALLGLRIPVLFLLDLWGQDTDVKEPYLTPRVEIEERVAGFKTLGAVYDGLEDFPGDRNNEYLRRLFTIVDGWRELFEEVCGRIGQNRKYGLANLQGARENYPGVPAVFYTRKSLINDAVAVFEAAADGFFIKPTGKDDAETRILTRAYAPKLIQDLSLLVDRNIERVRGHQELYRAKMAKDAAAIEGLISSWRKLRNK